MITSKIIRSSDIAACPKTSLLPGHYHADGVCRCARPDDPVEDWVHKRPSHWTPEQKAHVWNLVNRGVQ